MQTPSLSPAQRAYMNDPVSFRKRMERRAETLFADGYGVEPGDGTGLFTVTTPNGETYSVDALNTLCQCAYQQKAEIPQVPCKHLLGLEGLVVEVLTDLKTFAALGRPDWKTGRMASHNALLAHWQDTCDALQAAQAEADEDGRLDTEAAAIDGELRGSYGISF